MLNPDRKIYPSMNDDELKQFQIMVAEEAAAKEENVAAAILVAPMILEACGEAVEIVKKLRGAREATGVSLAELESRTGMLKSALSRLENGKAPNLTLSDLQRYANTIECRLVVGLEDVR